MAKKTHKLHTSFKSTRKTIRKEKRALKKKHRQEHYLKKKNNSSTTKVANESPGKFVKLPQDVSSPTPKVKNKKDMKQPSAQDILARESIKVRKEANKLQFEMEKKRKKIFLEANEDEDKIIKKLEKQLGLNKTKNKNNFFAEDGLDYLLEICDRTTSEQIVAAEKHLADVEKDSDFEEDLAVVTGKEITKKVERRKKEKEESEEELFSNDEMEEDDNDDELNDSDSELSVSEDHEMSCISDNDSESNDIHKESNDEFENKEHTKISMEEQMLSENVLETKDKSDTWEDIYGRKRDKDGNIIKEEKGVYIPPHLKNKDSNKALDTQLIQLNRQIKSVLNKLAGTNLHWACTTIENLYANNSRHSVNTALTRFWLEATVGVSVTPDRLVAEHAALVSVLHANVGSEIGAHFLEELCRKFDEMLKSPQPMEDKRLDNLVTCLAYLYSFKIYHGSLLYDILGALVQQLTEKNIDCVLAVLRAVGGVLRKEEPAALKSFIQETQARVATLNEAAAAGSRIKYLLEVLLAVKNNNLNKIPGYEPTYAEELRRAARAVLRRGNYVTALNIRLHELLGAHERGKWWVVGSAWEGSRVQDDQPTVRPPPSTDQKLLELARKQRMNTDVRRSIFCVIMSAEDYMDAFEKLQHLGLKGQQEREVVHVLLACCLQEKKYNPYYAVLAMKLCDVDRRYQLSIQYSVWDKIKELETMSAQWAANLAQLLTHLIMEKGLPLSVLKVIQFSDLNKTTVRFMRQILLAIMMNADLQASLEVFHRISKPPKLHMFRESLRLFIQHFLIKNVGKKNNVLSDDEMATLKERSVEVNKMLTLHESKLRL